MLKLTKEKISVYFYIASVINILLSVTFGIGLLLATKLLSVYLLGIVLPGNVITLYANEEITNWFCEGLGIKEE